MGHIFKEFVYTLGAWFIILIGCIPDYRQELFEFNCSSFIFIYFFNKHFNLTSATGEPKTNQWGFKLLNPYRSWSIFIKLIEALKQFFEFIIAKFEHTRFASLAKPFPLFQIMKFAKHMIELILLFPHREDRRVS